MSGNTVGHIPVQYRFWTKVWITKKCWLWIGSANPNGYGKIKIRNKQLSTHRVSYEINVGPIKDGLHVLHKCDNRRCVRPDHLFLGTPLDNVRDALQKGRMGKKGVNRGESHPKAKLTEKKVLEIRQMLKTVKIKDIAKKMGVKRTAIYNIRDGISWGWL